MKVKGKPKKDEIKGVVYSISCECGATYIGETRWNLHTRVQEHKWAVCKGDTNNSIAVHVIKMNYTIQWEKAWTITTEPLNENQSWRIPFDSENFKQYEYRQRPTAGYLVVHLNKVTLYFTIMSVGQFNSTQSL